MSTTIDPVLKASLDQLVTLYEQLMKQYGENYAAYNDPITEMLKALRIWTTGITRKGYLRCITTLDYKDETSFDYTFNRAETIKHEDGTSVSNSQYKRITYEHNGSYHTKMTNKMFNPLSTDFARGWFIFPDASYDDLSITPSYHKECLEAIKKAFTSKNMVLPHIGIYVMATQTMPVLDESQQSIVGDEYEIDSKKRVKGSASYQNGLDSNSAKIEAAPVYIDNGTWGAVVDHTFYFVHDLRDFANDLKFLEDVIRPTLTWPKLEDMIQLYPDQQIKRVNDVFDQFRRLPKDAQIGYILNADNVFELINAIKTLSVPSIISAAKNFGLRGGRPKLVVHSKLQISPFSSTQISLEPKKKNTDISALRTAHSAIIDNNLGSEAGYFNGENFNIDRPNPAYADVESYDCGEIGRFTPSMEFSVSLGDKEVANIDKSVSLDTEPAPFNNPGSTIETEGSESFTLNRHIKNVSLHQNINYQLWGRYKPKTNS